MHIFYKLKITYNASILENNNKVFKKCEIEQLYLLRQKL